MLRPEIWDEDGFLLPLRQLKPTLEETWDGIKAMLMEIKKDGMEPNYYISLNLA